MTEKPSYSMAIVKWLLSITPKMMQDRDFERYQRRLEKLKEAAPALIPRRIFKNCKIEEDLVNGQKVFTFIPEKKTQPVHFIFTHGGAYVTPITIIHWFFISQLIEYTGASISVPLYPLAPEYEYQLAFQELEIVYQKVLEKFNDDAIVLCGDSAGGGLALAQALYYREKGFRLPDRIILFSPWLDITMSNPEAEELEPKDVLLDIESLIQCGKWWAGDEDPRNPLLSPIYGDLSGLPPVDIYVGTDEVFLPDARKFAELVKGVGGEINLYEYPGAFHDFVIATFTDEAKDAFNKIINTLHKYLQD